MLACLLTYLLAYSLTTYSRPQVIAKGEALGFEVITEEEPTASIDLDDLAEEADAEDKPTTGAAEEATAAAPAPASLEA